MRNRVDALRRESKRWDRLDLTGWMEADPFEVSQIEHMQPRMREYLDAEGPRLMFPDRPAWIVHLHAVVHHPTLDWQEVRDALARQFDAPHAVDVSPCTNPRYDGQDAPTAIWCMTRYAHMTNSGRMLWGERGAGSAIDVFDASWMADLHAHLYNAFPSRSGHSQGFRPWRCQIKSKSGQSSRSSPIIDPDDIGYDDSYVYDDDEHDLNVLFCSVF